MKLFIFIILAMTGKVYAASPKPLKCIFDVQHQCTAEKCNSVKPKVWVELDVAKAQYKRCDSQGCDSYDLESLQSGVFINFRTKQNNGLTAKLDQNGTFMESNSIMMQTNVSYGKCAGLK